MFGRFGFGSSLFDEQDPFEMDPFFSGFSSGRRPNLSSMLDNGDVFESALSGFGPGISSGNSTFSSQTMVMSNKNGKTEKFVRQSHGQSRNGDRISQSRAMYENDHTGERKMAMDRRLNDKGRTMYRSRNREGEEESRDVSRGMTTEEQLKSFDEAFQSRWDSGRMIAPGRDERLALPSHGRRNIPIEDPPVRAREQHHHNRHQRQLGEDQEEIHTRRSTRHRHHHHHHEEREERNHLRREGQTQPRPTHRYNGNVFDW
eukprot:TRINITY_DN777823_c0_g1_i1.p1 TRINITY_DN777823_c0_g1~~TRINITY_DN777823_c0_g1_i1.p1  ORF type:complete len:280 (+),score=54.40 TRINITY_DN777823_c0_g1_i1:64-840(+)